MRVPSLAGLAAALWLGCLRPGPWPLAVGGCAVLALAAAVARRRPRGAWVVALLAMALLGAGLAGGRLVLAERGELSALAEAARGAEVRATVVTEPRPSARGHWKVVRVTSVDGVPTRQRALLRADLGDGEGPLPLGARLEFRAAAEPLGADGFHRHLRRLGAVAEVWPRGPVEQVGAPPRPIAASTLMRERARAAFGRRLDDERAALLAGLTTGDVTDRPEGQRELFAAAGLSHLVVVSGKHTALMLAGVLGLCAVLGIGARGSRLVGLAALAWFVVLVRWQPSVLRAGAMACMVLLAGLLGRGRLSGRLLWGAVLLLLLAEPLLAGRLGFALSVLATAGVLLLGPRLAGCLRGPGWLRWTAAATLGAQAGVAPVLVATDGGVPTAALPANLVAGPAAAVAQAVGLTSGLLAQGAAGLAGWTALLADPFLRVVLWSAEAFAGMPALEARHLLRPPTALAALGALAAWRRRHALAATALALAVAVALAGSWRGPAPVDHLTVTALDVGQGDALLVEAPDGAGGTARMLYDGGPDRDLVRRLLAERRVRRLDVVVVSHGHYDHVAGLPAVLERVEVGALVVGAAPDPVAEPPGFTGEVLEAAAGAGVPVRLVEDGDRFALGSAVVSVLGPPSRPLAGGDLNENSVVLRVDGAHGSLLLTGDAEEVAQRRLLRRPGRVRADVVQVPHHGAATNAAGFLAATGAAVGIVSVGEGNTHGHPHPDTLADLALAGVTVRRTDTQGTVTVTLGPAGPLARQGAVPATAPPGSPTTEPLRSAAPRCSTAGRRGQGRDRVRLGPARARDPPRGAHGAGAPLNGGRKACAQRVGGANLRTMDRGQAGEFASVVRRAREARGLSIRGAAAAGGVSDTTWRRLEDAEELLRYDPRPATLRAVAEALRVTLDQVFHWAGRTFDGIAPPKPLGDALAELDERQRLPAALSGASADLTDEDWQRVRGYIDALAEERRRARDE